MLLAQIKTGLETIDHAASQNDRWAFFASLGILLVFGYFVLRHFITTNMALTKAVQETSERYHENLNKIILQVSNMNRDVGIALSESNKLQERCLRELEKRR